MRAKIKAKDFKAALAELTPMLETHQHADVYNLMGFSLRKTGDYKQAYTFYRKALEFDPEHKGALEYLGELYVETGQIDKARENVALLKKLCPGGCEELADLEAGGRRRLAESELRRGDVVTADGGGGAGRPSPACGDIPARGRSQAHGLCRRRSPICRRSACPGSSCRSPSRSSSAAGF